MNAYIDGGSRRSLIGRTLANKLGDIRPCKPRKVQGFNGAGRTVICNTRVKPNVVVDGQLYIGSLHIVEDEQLAPDDVLLGTNLLCNKGRSVVYADKKCTLVPSIAECAEMNWSHVAELLEEFKRCFSDTMAEIG